MRGGGHLLTSSFVFETKSMVRLMAIQEKKSSLLSSTFTANVDIGLSSRAAAISASLPLRGQRKPQQRAPLENLINNMTFMLPFQFFNPLPPALIGSLPDPYVLEQSQDQARTQTGSHGAFPDSRLPPLPVLPHFRLKKIRVSAVPMLSPKGRLALL